MQVKSQQKDREGKHNAVCSSTCAGRIAHPPESSTPADPSLTGSHFVSQLVVTGDLKHSSALQPPSPPIPLSFCWRSPSFHVCHRKSLFSARAREHCSTVGEAAIFYTFSYSEGIRMSVTNLFPTCF